MNDRKKDYKENDSPSSQPVHKQPVMKQKSPKLEHKPTFVLSSNKKAFGYDAV